jgi:hypothetical protein
MMAVDRMERKNVGEVRLKIRSGRGIWIEDTGKQMAADGAMQRCASGENVLRKIIRSGSKQKHATKCAVAMSQHRIKTKAARTRLRLQERTLKGRR